VIKVFKDCFGRNIGIGDVIVNGHRYGADVGVVLDFTEYSIIVDKVMEGHWDAVDNKPEARPLHWSRTVMKAPGKTFITGQSRDDLERELDIMDEIQYKIECNARYEVWRTKFWGAK
jgi:hypothetical protein